MSQHEDLIVPMASTTLAPVEDEGDHHQTTSQIQKQVDLTPRLDALPTEIRQYLLHFLDLDSLSSLVHASPIYHAQYREDRSRILIQSVEHTTPDEFKIRLLRSQKPGEVQDIAEFFRSYSGATARQALDRQGQADLSVALSMASFYFNVVKPLADKFACSLLERLAQEIPHTDPTPNQNVKLSSSERARITRGIYRFLLFREIALPDFWKPEKEVRDFLLTLEPWEIEELHAFYDFAYEVYAKLVDTVRSDLHPDNPRFADQARAPTPDGAFELEIYERREAYIESLILKGLEFLHSAVFDVKEHEQLVSWLQENMTFQPCHLRDRDETLYRDTMQQEKLYREGSERSKKMDDQTPMPFQGDDRLDTPPLAWTILWREVYSSLYDSEVPRPLQLWGYVFWDESRLKSTGAIEVIEREMKEWTDPRDYEADSIYSWARDPHYL